MRVKLGLIGLMFIILVIFEIVVFENFIDKMMYLFNTKSLTIASFYLLVTFIGFLSIILLFFIRNKIIFFFFYLFLLLTYSIDLVYKNINQMGFSLNDLGVALAQADAFGLDALSTYADAIEQAGVVMLLFTIFVFIIRKIIVKNRLFISLKWVLSTLIIAFSLSYLILYRTAGATQTRPTNFKIANLFIYSFTNSLYYGERDKLKKEPVNVSTYKNIIFIVDESIGGKYLGINGYDKETTPYLKSIKESYINLGLASSAANCSDSSNILLMSGLQLNELPDKENNSLKRATLFQYGKKAGYMTHYLSGQSVGDYLQNHMTKYDLPYIDTFMQPEVEDLLKDMPEEDIIKETKKILKNSKKNFIYMLKHGAHFQWENSYTETEKYFLPTLGGDSDALSLDKKEYALNSYRNAVRYNVDLFFKHLLQEIDFKNLKDTLIIYTSDHGQSILEEGRTSTHCDSKNPPLSQGVVPLLLFSTKDNKTLEEVSFSKDIYSHYQIFPTIIKLMGYETKEKSLFDVNKENSEQIFVSGDIFGRVALQKNDINKH